MGFTVEMDEAEYRIVGPGGEEGPETQYGDAATLVIGGAVYYSHVVDPDTPAGDVKIYRVDSVSEVQASVEEVQFGDEEDDMGGNAVVDEEMEVDGAVDTAQVAEEEEEEEETEVEDDDDDDDDDEEDDGEEDDDDDEEEE